MGKIFGISDLPVSTIMTPFEPVKVPEPMVTKKSYIPPKMDIVQLSKSHEGTAKTLKKFVKSFMKSTIKK